MAFHSLSYYMTGLYLLSTVKAQFPDPYFPVEAPHLVLRKSVPTDCPAVYRSANASGTYVIQEGFANGDWQFRGGSDQDFTWTVSVAENKTSGRFETDSWLGTPAGIDLRLGNLKYSGCAFYMAGLSQNLIRRAQQDNGNCSAMLDDPCVYALQKQIGSIAFGYVATFSDPVTGRSNLTAGSLPTVCAKVGRDIQGNGSVPAACEKFVGQKRTWNDGVYSNITFVVTPITGPNSTTDLSCSFNTTTLPSFSQLNSNVTLITATLSPPNITDVDPSTYRDGIYNAAITNVYPIITVFFPPANDSNRSGGSVTTREAFLTCARPVNITEGSKTAIALPPPTPLRKVTRPLSTGAKAGIAVGVVVGALIIISLLVWFLLSRRKQRREKAAAEAAGAELKHRT